MGVFSELDMEMRENGVSFAGENPFAETRPCLKNRGNCSNQQEGNGGKVKERQE